MMLRTLALAALLAGASCGRPGLHGPLAELRAEIQDLERNVPPEAPLWPDQGENAFNRYIEDNTPRIPDFIYNHVVAKLSAMSDAAIEAAVQPKLDLPGLLGSPAPARGKLWRVSGRIGHLGVEHHSIDGKARAREVFVGTLFAGEQPVHFHVIAKPDVVYLGSDEVELIGVFIKVLAYPRPGEPTTSAPFFLAKGLRKYY